MNLVLDAGALIGIERRDRRVAGLMELGRRAGASLSTVAPVVGQVWRGSARQVDLARSLRLVGTKPTSLDDAKRAGELLAQSDGSDVIDALLAGIVMPGDQVLTSEPGDIRALLAERGVPATVVTV